MKPVSTFINYSHPSEQREPQNRRAVASYIGTHYRNRSKPTARRKSEKDNVWNCAGQVTFEVHTPDTCTSTAAFVPSRKSTSPDEKRSLSSRLYFDGNIIHDKHGFRSDPFQSYPIESRASLTRTVDFFMGFYGPSHLIRPEIVSAETGAVLMRQIFQYALNNALLFEAMMAVSQAGMTAGTWSTQGPDQNALWHYDRTLAQLRGLLSEDQAYSEDAVLFAIVALMGVDYLLNDMVAYAAHIAGMRRIIKMRGGMDKLGWPTVLKPLIMGVESFWTYVSKNQPQATPSPQPESPSNETIDCIDIAYPYTRRPVTDLKELIEALPAGFQQLTLKYRLSVPVITLIHRVVTNKGFLQNTISESGGYEINAANHQEWLYSLQLLSDARMTCAERVCCLGMMLTITEHNHTARYSPHYLKQIQHHAAELTSFQSKFSGSDLSDVFLWVSLDIAGTMFPPRAGELPPAFRDDNRFKLLMAVVREYQSMTWNSVLAIMTKFICTKQRMQSWYNAWQMGQEGLKADISSDNIAIASRTNQGLHSPG